MSLGMPISLAMQDMERLSETGSERNQLRHYRAKPGAMMQRSKTCIDYAHCV
jgi:hypothetical protein